MSRSRKKRPYANHVGYSALGQRQSKRLHHKRLRAKIRRYLYSFLTYKVPDDFPLSSGFKNIEGIDIYCMPSDGGPGYIGNSYVDVRRRIRPDWYSKCMRK